MVYECRCLDSDWFNGIDLDRENGMKLTVDHVILAISVATIVGLGYLIVSTCLLYRNEYERGCKNGISIISCDGQERSCDPVRYKRALDKCMEHKDL